MRGLKKTASNGADAQTDRQTHGHGDSMTNSAQWGRVGENAVGYTHGLFECLAAIKLF